MPLRDVAFIAIGSNLGDRHAYLSRARAEIGTLPCTRILAESSIEETEPIGPPEQGAYLNQMISVETELSPRELLQHLQQIEQRAGRERGVRWGPRTLDLDIVAFTLQTVSDADLHVPHRELPARKFWQRELAELRSRE